LILNQVLFEITGRHRKQSHCETWSRYLKNQENWPQWRHNYWRHAEWRGAKKSAGSRPRPSWLERLSPRQGFQLCPSAQSQRGTEPQRSGHPL